MSADGKLGWRDDHGPIRGQMLLVRGTILGRGKRGKSGIVDTDGRRGM